MVRVRIRVRFGVRFRVRVRLGHSRVLARCASGLDPCGCADVELTDSMRTLTLTLTLTLSQTLALTITCTDTFRNISPHFTLSAAQLQFHGCSRHALHL